MRDLTTSHLPTAEGVLARRAGGDHCSVRSYFRGYAGRTCAAPLGKSDSIRLNMRSPAKPSRNDAAAGVLPTEERPW